MRALVSIASATLLIRVFGMGMQIVVTARFGLGPAMDSYFIAAAVPVLVAGALTYPLHASVVPVYVRVLGEGNRRAASSLFSTLLNVAVIASVLVMVLMLVFRREVILVSAPGADSALQSLAVGLAPVVFPSLVLTVVLGVFEAVLNADGQFGWPSYAGLLVPVATTGVVLLAGRSLGVVTLAIGTLVGLCLQTCAFMIRLRRAGIMYRPSLEWRNPALRAVAVAMWPLVLSSCILPITPLVDQMFASGLSVGSISALNYALKLVGVPTGVLFMAVGRATLPYLSRYAAAGDVTGLKTTLRLYLWIVGIGTSLVSAALLVLAHPLVHILFQRGAFTSADADRTAITFLGFVPGLVPMAAGFLIAGVFSAVRRNRVLLYTDICTLIGNVLFDYLLSRVWQSFGIALATSVVYACNAIILTVILRRVIGPLGFLTPPPELLQLVRSVRLWRSSSLSRP
jgi:putative peptidoglycan lipid II flippase